ncbi:ABC transporter substrate-binding protein [Pelagibacterium lentulum]|uniref:Iron siderophore-binding protein n=1 Tax=Pelagibacterium lentulum TaxID=2029865 RepID=A0A916RBA0_9HYPH|nr:iron-siderophore ABC transporter substrate-binding protein [Pelagibacterium lentulum]GGA49782.1 iron siderophore-binding protein [Pelagibacterium lentulum]
MLNFRFTLAGLALAALMLPSALQAHEVSHAMGITDVPDNPQRVVVLTNEGTEAVLALGITPVGAVRSWLGDPWYDHIAEAMADVMVLGEESAVNLELLAALEPDLILANMSRQEGIYEQLSAIAPTVVSERLRGDWRINFTLYAEALGKSEDGAAVLARYDARIADLSEALGESLEEEISLARFMSGQTRMYYNDTFAGLALRQLGFARPQTQDKEEFADAITKERIPELEGDRLFYYVYETGNDEGNAQAQDWLNDPLWLALDVVKNGNVHPVSDAIWNTAGGVIAANLMLDDIASIYGVQD